MAKFKRMLAFLLVLTMIFSMGETLALAADGDDVLDGTSQDSNSVDPTETPEPSDEPETPPEATEAPTDDPEATEQPEATEAPTDDPEATEEPADDPEATPEPSEDPNASPEPSTTPEPSASPEPEHKEWPWTEPGNEVSVLMGGGRYLDSGGSSYSSDGGLYLNGSLLSGVDAWNLNLVDGWLYYTAGSSVMRMPSGGGSDETVLTAEDYIDQMYVMGQEIRYVAGGSVYSFDMNDGMTETLEAPDGVQKFIPTPYGNLFFTGSWPSFALWAEQTQVASGLENGWSDGDWLVVAVNSETMQTSLPALFQGSYSPQAYSLHQDMAQPASALSEEAQLAAESAYYESAEYAAIQASLRTSANNGIMTISSSAVRTKPLTQQQLNIVQRAQQHAAFTWKALKDVCAWGGDDGSYMSTKGDKYIKDTSGNYSGKVNKSKWGYFLQGHTYRGVPYSWPIGYGYVGWNVTLAQFRDAVNNANSDFYKKQSTQERTAPYYGSDCSGFVSYAWDLPQRCTCTSLKQSYSTYIGTDYTKLQVGYAINNPSSHVMLVTDLGYNSEGNIVSVEVTEQTPPKMQVTVYGETIGNNYYDYNYSLTSLQDSYLKKGYGIYARSCKDSVDAVDNVAGTNTNTPAAPTISLKALGPDKAEFTLKHSDSSAKIYYTANAGSNTTTPTNESTEYRNSPIQVTATDSYTINAVAYKGDIAGYVLSKTFPHTGNVPRLILQGASDTSGVYRVKEEGVDTYYVAKGSKLSFLVPSGASVYYTTDGTEPTTSSYKVDGSTAIEADTIAAGGHPIKAFVANPDCIPGSKVEFEIATGDMYTVKVEDLYGLVTSPDVEDISDAVNVPQGKEITFDVAKEKDGYKLDYVLVDGEKKGEGQYKFMYEAGKEHSLKVVVKLEYKDAPDVKYAWQLRAMEYVTATGIMQGKDNGKFEPDGYASRAMFITVLGRYAKYYDSINKTNLSKLYVSTSGSTNKYVEAAELDVDHRVGVTDGYYINVRSAPTTKVSNSYAQLKERGMLVEVLGSQMSEGRVWFTVNYRADTDTQDRTGYVCQTDGTKEILKVCNFGDITSKNVAYCNGWVQWGYMNGLVEGYSAGTFGANYAISRQDVCVLMYNFMKNIVGIAVSTNDATAGTYSDYKNVDKYAKDAVAAMVNIGVLTGNKPGSEGGKLQLKTYATRAMVAKMFMAMDDYLSAH